MDHVTPPRFFLPLPVAHLSMPSAMLATTMYFLVFQEQLRGHHKEDSTCEWKVIGLFTGQTLRVVILDTESLSGKRPHSQPSCKGKGMRNHSAASMSHLLWKRKDDSENEAKSPEEGAKSLRNPFPGSRIGPSWKC